MVGGPAIFIRSPMGAISVSWRDVYLSILYLEEER
jgi:hypothetical protein